MRSLYVTLFSILESQHQLLMYKQRSSIVTKAIRTILSLFIFYFIFFLQKDFERTKACHMQKPATKQKQANTKQ